jgi:hypothetical protein
VGDWFVGTNWLSGSPPSAGSILIDNGGTAQRNQVISSSLASLYLGNTPTGSGSLLLSAGTLSFSVMNIGPVGAGWVDQAGSALSAFSIHIATDSSQGHGQYLLSGGTLTVSTLDVGATSPSSNGTFTQSGGVATVNWLDINSGGYFALSGGTLLINGELVNHGHVDLSDGTLIASRLVDLSAGTLTASPNAHVVGKAGSLIVLPAGFDPNTAFGYYSNLGKTLISGDTLFINAGEKYELSGELHEKVSVAGTLFDISLMNGLNVLSAGQVRADKVAVKDIDSSLSGGWLSLNQLTVGAPGGALFSHTSGQLDSANFPTTIGIGTFAGESGTYFQSDGTLIGGSITLGGAGTGTYILSGGTASFGSVTVNSGSTLRYTGGSLSLDAVTIRGTLDLGNSAVTVAPIGIADFGSTTFQGAASATLIGAPNSLMTFAPGIDPAIVFGSFSSQGIVHTAGTTIVLNAGQTVAGHGVIEDRVHVHGTLDGPELFGGINVFPGGQATVFRAHVTDATSGISGGKLTVQKLSIAGNGVFTQTGGDVVFALTDSETSVNRGLTIGLDPDPAMSGTYILDGGTLSSASGFGNFTFNMNNGTFLQNGGSNVALIGPISHAIGASSGSHAYYGLSGGTFIVSGDRLFIGNIGAGTFEQSGGYASIPQVRIAFNPGSTGYYSLSGNGSLNVASVIVIGSSGNGTFIQSGGTFTAGAIFTQNLAGSSGYFNKSDGQLTAGSFTNSGTFIHSGGTLSITSLMSNSGAATLGGIQAWNSNATFTNTGAATFTTNAGSLARNLTLNANDGSVVFASSQSLKTINITNGTIKIQPAAGIVVGAAALNAAGAPANAFDLADGTFVYHYDTLSPDVSVRSLLFAAQMYSSLADAQHRVAYAEAAQLYTNLPATLGDESLDSTTLLVKLALAGDTNLDGTVDVADLGNLALHWSSSDQHWFDGDFTYDGLVDVADLKLLGMNFQAAPGAASLETLLGSFGLPIDAVPEPAVLLGPIGVALLGRRPRSRRK